MRIVKKQTGGFLQYQPQSTPIEALSWVGAGLNLLQSRKQATSTSSNSSNKKSESSGDVGLLTKDMVKLLYENGLPNDVEQFIQNIDIFGSTLGGNPFVDSSSSASQEAQYKQILSILPKLKLNKDQYDKAVEHAQANNTITETAVSPDGRVYVYGEDGLSKKYIYQLSKNENPITVGELARIRAYSPDSSFDSGDIAITIGNSLSKDQVFKAIQEVVNKIGTDSFTNEVYVRKDSSESKAAQGLKQLLAEAEDGIYTVKQKRETQKDKAINYTLRFIWDTLPTNARVLLQDYARKNKFDLKTGPLQLISDFITGQLDETIENTLGGSGNSGSGSKDGDGLKNAQDFNQSMQVITGDFLPTRYDNITPGNSNYAYTVKVGIIPYIQKANSEENVEAGKLSAALYSSKLGNVIDKSSLHAGSQLISTAQLQRIYYDGSGAITMELPFTRDANGKIMPDWSVMDKYAQAQKEIERNPSMSAQQQNAIYQKYGLGEYFLINRTPDNRIEFIPNRQRFMRFVAINAIGDEGAFVDADDHSDTFVRIDEDGVEDMIASALGTDKRDMEIEGNLYKTVIYAPVFDSYSNAMMGGGTPIKIPLKSAEEIGYQENEMRKQSQKQHNSQLVKNMI